MEKRNSILGLGWFTLLLVAWPKRCDFISFKYTRFWEKPPKTTTSKVLDLCAAHRLYAKHNRKFQQVDSDSEVETNGTYLSYLRPGAWESTWIR